MPKIKTQFLNASTKPQPYDIGHSALFLMPDNSKNIDPVAICMASVTDIHGIILTKIGIQVELLVTDPF